MKKSEKIDEQIVKNQKNEIEQPTPVVNEPPIAYQAHRYSYADYLIWTDDVMREIIDGIVYAFSAPVKKHATAVISFIIKAGSFIHKRKAKCKIFTAPFDVRLPKNGETDNDKIYNVVQPDICVICDPAKLDDSGCIGAPDLIVEVNSPSTSRLDLDKKFKLYEETGVKEYWVVFPKEKKVTVFLLQPDEKYDKGTTYEVVSKTTKVPVQTLKGLIIDLEELFKD